MKDKENGKYSISNAGGAISKTSLPVVCLAEFVAQHTGRVPYWFIQWERTDVFAIHEKEETLDVPGVASDEGELTIIEHKSEGEHNVMLKLKDAPDLAFRIVGIVLTAQGSINERMKTLGIFYKRQPSNTLDEPEGRGHHDMVVGPE